MDRLIKRNQEVHDENTRLEDEMSSMEKTLVETKMNHAEVCPPRPLSPTNFTNHPQLNASHETLLRKWTDLRKALD
jgi:hypothetical protein